ncbi:MAG: hypothetical protein ACOCV1_01975 [Bacillota bacterium]
MLCKLCTKYYLQEESFSNLFNFESICEDCKQRYKPIKNFEIIPINQGEIHYYYLYENISLSLSQELILDKHLSKIYQQILNGKQAYNLILYLDDYIFNNLVELQLLSFGFAKIFLFSLIRKQIDRDIIF